MQLTTSPRRLLKSPLVDLLVGPHGIDRYLELVRPELTIRDVRAEVVAVRRQTRAQRDADAAPEPRLGGLPRGSVRPRQRRDRRGSPHADLLAGRLAARHGPKARADRHHAPRGPRVAVADRLRAARRDRATSAQAQGEFVLPDARPERLVLISGGSGITPVMSMLRTLCDESYAGEISVHPLRAHRGRLALSRRAARRSPPGIRTSRVGFTSRRGRAESGSPRAPRPELEDAAAYVRLRPAGADRRGRAVGGGSAARAVCLRRPSPRRR